MRTRTSRAAPFILFEGKRDIFEELLEQAVRELRDRIQRLKVGPGELDPIEQLRNNVERVLNFVLTERDLTDILLNHSTGFDHELDDEIQDFYDRIDGADQAIARPRHRNELGAPLRHARCCPTHPGGIKEVVLHALAQNDTDISALVEEILQFGLSGVARPELLNLPRYAMAHLDEGGGCFF